MAVALGPCRAWAVTENFCSFPPSLTTWTYNGNAFEQGNAVIRLTDDLVLSEASSAFITTPIPITAATVLHAYFRFSMGPNPAGGDGVAFVLQNSPTGAAALGGFSTSMGYGGITPSVVIEFGTFKNTGGTEPANNVSMVLNGSTTANVATNTSPGFIMAGAGILSAWVDYNPTGTLFSVYLSTTATKPATPVLTHSTALTALGTQMYVGFSSATGATAQEGNENDIYELEVSTAGVPCACEGDSACSGAAGTPACDAAGICAICSATNASGCPLAMPVCDVPLNTCVGCLSNANCASPTPICDTTALTCRACNPAKPDCSAPTPLCDQTAGSANDGDCVLCLSNADCSNASIPRCNAANVCVQCLSAADCGGDSPVCDAAGTCTACASDADCVGSANGPACEVWGACGQCSSTNASQCTGGDAICDFPSGTCVSCEFNTDCTSAAAPACDTTTHLCQPCATDADCAGNLGGPVCETAPGLKQGSCVLCAADTDCTNPATPVCDTVSNQCVGCLTSANCAAPTAVCSPTEICVGCLTSANCSGATPACNPTSSQCTACASDYSATNPGPDPCPTAALAACQPATSPLVGTCQVCSSLNDSACVTTATTPVCYAPTAVCGCNLDTDCNTNFYCDTTAVVSGVCTAGCRVVGDAGASNCASGDYCTVTDGTVGVCMSEPCNSNAECAAPTPVCNTVKTPPFACVACLNNPDCPTGQVCDQTMNKCVQCTSNTSCTTAATGPVCLGNETCGCTKDGDCGGPGTACDGTTHTCGTGCHTTGGNGCPSGETCVAGDGGTLGQCQTGTTTTSSGTGASGNGGGMATGTGGAGGAATRTVTQAIGCGCRVGPDGDEGRLGALAAVALALAFSRRRRSARAC